MGLILMQKKDVIYTAPLTGTISEAKESKNHNTNLEFGEEFSPIQEMWEVNPVEEVEYDGTIGYKDS